LRPSRRKIGCLHPTRALKIGTSDMDPTDVTAARHREARIESKRKHGPQIREPGSSVKPRHESLGTAKPSAKPDTLPSFVLPPTPPSPQNPERGAWFGLLFLALCAVSLVGLWLHLNETTKDGHSAAYPEKGIRQKLWHRSTTLGPLLLPQTRRIKGGKSNGAWWNHLDPKEVQDKERLKKIQGELGRLRESVPPSRGTSTRGGRQSPLLSHRREYRQSWP